MELFLQSLTIMTLGMTLVFFFIFIVIQCMNLIAFLIRRHEANHPAAAEAPDQAVRARLAAAIAVATDFTCTRN